MAFCCSKTHKRKLIFTIHYFNVTMSRTLVLFFILTLLCFMAVISVEFFFRSLGHQLKEDKMRWVGCHSIFIHFIQLWLINNGNCVDRNAIRRDNLLGRLVTYPVVFPRLNAVSRDKWNVFVVYRSNQHTTHKNHLFSLSICRKIAFFMCQNWHLAAFYLDETVNDLDELYDPLNSIWIYQLFYAIYYD